MEINNLGISARFNPTPLGLNRLCLHIKKRREANQEFLPLIASR